MPDLDVHIPFPQLREYGCPWGRQHVRRLVRQRRFPAPVELSPQRIAWRRSDLLAWQQSRPERTWRRPPAAGTNEPPAAIVEAAPAERDAAEPGAG